MNQSRSEINRQQIEWRHSQVLQLAADGYSEREIAPSVKDITAYDSQRYNVTEATSKRTD